MNVTVAPAVRPAVRRCLHSGRGGFGGVKIPRTNLLAYYRGGVDTIGESTVLRSYVGSSDGPVQPGRGYTGDGSAYITIAGLLTTDVITADSTDVPTCTVNGRLEIGAGDIVYGVRITRGSDIIGYFPCAEGVGTISINARYQYGLLEHGILSSDSIHTDLVDGTGFDVNLSGFVVAGSGVFAEAGLENQYALNTIIPIVDGIYFAYQEAV